LTGLLKDNLSKVVQHGRRADSIVKNMLLHSREGSGKRRTADTNALVRESLNLAHRRAGRKPASACRHLPVQIHARAVHCGPWFCLSSNSISLRLVLAIRPGFYPVFQRISWDRYMVRRSDERDRMRGTRRDRCAFNCCVPVTRPMQSTK